MAQLVKNLPSVQKIWVLSLGWENPLKKGKATLQYPGLENSMDSIAHGVPKSQTRLNNFNTQRECLFIKVERINVH